MSEEQYMKKYKYLGLGILTIYGLYIIITEKSHEYRGNDFKSEFLSLKENNINDDCNLFI